MDNDDKIDILPPNVKIVIENRLVILRPILKDEINDRYILWLNDPETNKFLEVRHKKQSMKDVINYINSLRSRDGCELFAILTKKDRLHVGNIAITDYNPNGQGYAIYGIMVGDPKARMLGLGGVASALIIEYLFSKPIIRRIKEAAASDNNKAWKTLEFLGFKREGVLTQHVVLPSGDVIDDYAYGMLREEWIDARKGFTNILKNVKMSEFLEYKNNG